MMRWLNASALAIVLLAGCDEYADAAAKSGRFDEEQRLAIAQMSFGLAVPPPSPGNAFADDEAAAAFGQRLFFENRFSRTVPGATEDPISCAAAACHDPDQWFSPSVDTTTPQSRRDAPSLVNAAYNEWLSWDGRRDSVWAQALVPVEIGAMEGDRTTLAAVILEHHELEYQHVFGPLPADLPALATLKAGAPARPPNTWRLDQLDEARRQAEEELNDAWLAFSEAERHAISAVFANVGKAYEAYVRKLDSGNSPLDQWIEAGGLEEAAAAERILTGQQLRGLDLFVGKAGCVECHSGPSLSNGEFRAVGSPKATKEPEGRTFGIEDLKHRCELNSVMGCYEFSVTSPYSDDPERGAQKLARLDGEQARDFQFRTASLRHVDETGGFMYARQIGSLRDVVQQYNEGGDESFSEHQLDEEVLQLNLSEHEVDAIVEFLRALTGDEVPEALRRAPTTAFTVPP